MRVLFDSSDSTSSRINSQKIANIIGAPTIHTGGIFTGNGSIPIHSPLGNAPPGHSNYQCKEPNVSFTPRIINSPRVVSTPAKVHGTNPMVGDVGEPLWIQLSHPLGNLSAKTTTQQQTATNTNTQTSSNLTTQYTNNSIPNTPNPYDTHNMDMNRDVGTMTGTQTQNYSTWLDPDEASMTDTKKLISNSDKKIFWEMAKAIIELPEISEVCNSTIRNSKDIANLLKRPEFKILWTSDAADILPKTAAAELVTAAYTQYIDK